jgi:hypothetical protein
LCEECDLTIRVVRRAIEELGNDDIRVEVKPWLRHLFGALRRGGWHPPVVTIDREVFSQGVVPDAAALKERLVHHRGPSDDTAAPIRPAAATRTAAR